MKGDAPAGTVWLAQEEVGGGRGWGADDGGAADLGGREVGSSCVHGYGSGIPKHGRKYLMRKMRN